MEPLAVGLAEVVNWYCVVNAAVKVAGDDGAVMEWICAPLSDQLK
jgi:hypothetical protein